MFIVPPRLVFRGLVGGDRNSSLASLCLWMVTPPWCSWKMLTHLVLAKVFMPTKDRPNGGTMSASREVGRRSYGRCILCWDLQMLSLATDMVLLDGLRMGRLATAASASAMKLPVHPVSTTDVGNWWVARWSWCAVRIALAESCWWKCCVLVMGTWKWTWLAGLMRRALVF